MIVTLLKEGETVAKTEKEPERLTYSGISTLSHDALVLLHLCGYQPLYTLSEKLEIIDNPLPLPEMIFTGSKPIAVQSGKIMNYHLKHFDQPECVIKKGLSGVEFKAFPDSLKKTKHLIVIGNEKYLQKWAKQVCGEGQKRSENSSMCVVKDGNVVFDSSKPTQLYVTNGILNTLLIQQVNLLKREALPQELQQFHKKLKQPLDADVIMAYMKTQNQR